MGQTILLGHGLHVNFCIHQFRKYIAEFRDVYLSTIYASVVFGPSLWQYFDSYVNVRLRGYPFFPATSARQRAA
jgi:hypothetical protein